jgi:hypothetical protein
VGCCSVRVVLPRTWRGAGVKRGSGPFSWPPAGLPGPVWCAYHLSNPEGGRSKFSLSYFDKCFRLYSVSRFMRSRANLQCWLSKLCLSLLILFTALSRLAAEGVILLRDYPSQSAKIWKPYAFSKVEQFPSAYKVTFASGQVKSCTPDEVGGILESPKWLELFAMSDADWEKIKKQRDDLAAKTAQLPQVKDWASDEIAKFDKLLNSRSSLNVLYRGRLIAKEEFNKLQGNTIPTPLSSSAALTVGGKQFTNVKILSIKGGRLGFSHDGGIAGVQMSTLDTKQTEWVKAASPALFEAHLKELNMAGDKADQPGVSQNKDTGSTKEQASPVSVKDSDIAQNDSMAHQAYLQRSELLTEQFELVKKTFDDPNGANLEVLKSSDLDKKIKNDITKALDTYLSDMASLSSEKPSQDLSYISFTIIKNLDPKDFDTLAGLTGGLYEIAIKNVREHAILKTNSITFTSAGIAEMKVIFMREVDVELTNGFSTKTSVFEEAPDNLVAAWDRYFVKSSEIKNRLRQVGETIIADLLLDVAGNRFLGLLVEPTISISNELKTLGYKGRIQSPKLEILRDLLNDKDWKKVYAGVLTGELIHSKDGNQTLRPDTEECIPKSLQDIDLAVKKLLNATWPLVVQSNSHKGVVMQGQFSLNKKYVKGSNVFIEGANICLLAIPDNTAGVIPHKVTRSEVEKRGLNFRSPVLTEFYRECTEPHPDQNGVVEWVKFGGTDYVLFSDRGDKTNDFREEFRTKISDQIGTLNEQLRGEVKRYELSQNADQIDIKIGVLLSNFYRAFMAEALNNY